MRPSADGVRRYDGTVLKNDADGNMSFSSEINWPGGERPAQPHVAAFTDRARDMDDREMRGQIISATPGWAPFASSQHIDVGIEDVDPYGSYMVQFDPDLTGSLLGPGSGSGDNPVVSGTVYSPNPDTGVTVDLILLWLDSSGAGTPIDRAVDGFRFLGDGEDPPPWTPPADAPPRPANQTVTAPQHQGVIDENGMIVTGQMASVGPYYSDYDNPTTVVVTGSGFDVNAQYSIELRAGSTSWMVCNGTPTGSQHIPFDLPAGSSIPTLLDDQVADINLNWYDISNGDLLSLNSITNGFIVRGPNP